MQNMRFCYLNIKNLRKILTTDRNFSRILVRLNAFSQLTYISSCKREPPSTTQSLEQFGISDNLATTLDLSTIRLAFL